MNVTSLSKEVKPSVVNQQCVVYISHVICAISVTQHKPTPFPTLSAKHKYQAIGKHLTEAHGGSDLLNENCFKVLNKSQSKFDCLGFEMVYIKRLKPNLNVLNF